MRHSKEEGCDVAEAEADEGQGNDGDVDLPGGRVHEGEGQTGQNHGEDD